jgi:hypothetical protein
MVFFFGGKNFAFFPHKKNDFDTYTKYFMWKIDPNSPDFDFFKKKVKNKVARFVLH